MRISIRRPRVPWTMTFGLRRGRRRNEFQKWLDAHPEEKAYLFKLLDEARRDGYEPDPLHHIREPFDHDRRRTPRVGT